jgi:TonB-dependent SusC/RagA subfamily outer membrane receptor
MKIARLTATLALLIFASACASDRVVAPQRASSPFAVPGAALQLPLLYFVDGVRLPRDQVPNLQTSQVASFEIIKGSAALRLYGTDASYGVILITTKLAAATQ